MSSRPNQTRRKLVPKKSLHPIQACHQIEATHKKIHWKAYTKILAAFTAGTLLAFGHHLFNQNLAGTPVITEDHLRVIHGVSRQEFNSAINTTFAFLVKTCLILAVSTAYTQVIWKTIRNQKTTLSVIDSLFSILDDVFILRKISLWWKYLLLIFLAIISW